MNLRKYRELMAEPVPAMRLLAQDAGEWFAFLQFVSGYFGEHGIINPVVVEIGVMKNAQKVFYEQLMGAEHIGIDINPNCCPDILADSNDEETVEKLKGMIGERQIDLLFIDGNHGYGHVKCDYELYEPLASHLIAFHDICADVNSEVMRFWVGARFKKKYREFASSVLNHSNDISLKDNKFINMGIGVIIKGGAQ